jgi:hypothetical protein
VVEALPVRVRPAGSSASRPLAYALPLRIRHHDPNAPIFLYSATVGSIDRPDVAFGTAEPAFGTRIAPGSCLDVAFTAVSTGNSGSSFMANVLIRWGHTLPVGSDADHPGILVQVLVAGEADGVPVPSADPVRGGEPLP